jgi:methylmalonyl-CoA/ethylmalonyl-CoA epimerase
VADAELGGANEAASGTDDAARGDASDTAGGDASDTADGDAGDASGAETLLGSYVEAIDHVGVAVADLEVGKRWYAEHLGFRCVHEEVNAEQGVREAMLAVGSSGSYVQLLAPLTPESTIGRFLDRHGPGVQQVAYRVRDLDALTAELRRRGVRLLYDEARGGTAHSRVNFIHPKDAGGVLVELVEPAG